MILIADINAKTQPLDIDDTGHTPWTMWAKLTEDRQAYSMNYRQVDSKLIKDANLIILRVERNVEQEKVWPGFIKIIENATCPLLSIIEGDMNGFRNWKKEFHLKLSNVFNKQGIYMVSRDERIIPFYREFYDKTFYFASLFDVEYLNQFMVPLEDKDDLIFMPYAIHIGGDRNSKLSAILAHDLAEEYDCKIIMCQSDQHDALFAFKMGLDRIISLPFIETEDYLSILGQSKLCVNLDTIPGFGKVGAETACTRTFHLGTGTCGVTNHCWSHVSYPYLEYNQLRQLGAKCLEEPASLSNELDTAYNKVKDLDIQVGRQKLKDILGVDAL